VLIGAQDVAESALLARRLDAAGEKYGLLNGLQSDESAVVARAGLPGALTVATQLAGRGTDIKLDARARDAGGLLVLLTTMSDSPRVDLQYRGRAGRQGDPGESRLYVSLEDEVLARRATDAERDALAASLSADGADASPAADALLREIQRRAERDDAALRASLRGRDRVLAPSRARYFARRALWRALPLPFKSAVLTALHVGWGDFLAAHEDAWRGGGPGPSAEETARLFETRTLRPALAALLPQKLAAAAVRAAGSAVAEFFRDTFYARAFSWAARRTVAPAAGFVFAQAGRVLAAARLRAAVASLKPLTTAQREAVQTMPPYMDLVYLDMARTAIDAANYKNAKNYFSRVIAMDPSLVTAYAGRAYANRQLGETAAAADDIFAALRLRLLGTRQFENMRLVYSRRAGVSLDAARLDEAFAALRAGETAAEPPAAGEEAAEQARSQWRSGRARLNAGDARGAVAWFDRALSRDPRFARAYDDRGIARSRLGDLRGAYEDFADSLLWEVLDGGTWNNLIVGHTTRAQWTPAPGALAAFVARLKRL
jgi:Tfp pilus assembly protein PilF